MKKPPRRNPLLEARLRQFHRAGPDALIRGVYDLQNRLHAGSGTIFDWACTLGSYDPDWLGEVSRFAERVSLIRLVEGEDV
jgi:hypothetical protein